MDHIVLVSLLVVIGFPAAVAFAYSRRKQDTEAAEAMDAMETGKTH